MRDCFRFASWLVPLLLLACSAHEPAPVAIPGTGSAEQPVASTANAAAALPTTSTGALNGTSWQLVRFTGGDGARLVPDDGMKYTLQFGSDGHVAVRLDCNRGSGSWQEPSAGMLELGPMAMTRAACPPGSMHDQIVRQWPYVRSYVIRDGHLFLALMADGGIYEFTALSAPADAPATATLTNTYWKLMTLDGAAVTPAPGAREIHLILQLAQQRVSGFGGCNRLMGGYLLDGGQLSFSQLAGTMMACERDSMDTEQRFHAMLQKVARWRVDGEKLDLLDVSGATLAQFESRYMQ